ncbi:PQQ-dependent sugar dehydrogenase [Marmoricola endophyticus]|uniref:PQQ-dependent sugar dehydrogenase n=1 Tax=Marmoricola endophyticus TaxID=2040280 RepID=UPI00166EE9A6|nr:PQQ-dependent sugar dehydrogenase [Marmoricola endophyticus]
MRLPRRAAYAAPLAGVLLLSACGGGGSDSSGDAPSSPTATSSGSAASTAPKVVGTVATDLDAPWGIGFLPDGSALVTERDTGDILQVTPGADGAKATTKQVGSVDPNSSKGAEKGLLGLAVSPTYAQDKQVFLYLTEDDDNRVLRGTFDNGRISGLTPILTGIPSANIHDGGRMVFGPDGYLYVSTGESGDGPLAQDQSSLGGKILRITKDGKPAPGNPDPDSPVWTLGHRNVQGLAFDPDGRLWASEFGDQKFDELNLIQKGRNYGWPEVEGKGDKAGFTNPQVTWEPDSNSPSGLAYTDGHLWLGALQGERLWRVDVDGAKATNPTGFFVGDYGRMRSVVVAPDGNLWVTTSNRDGRGDPKQGDDRILEVSPGR